MHPRAYRLGVVATLFVAAAVLMGCGGPMAQRQGRVAVHLTDAPQKTGSLRRFELFVVRIDARRGEASKTDVTSGLDDGAAEREGWVTLSEPKQALDVLSLRGGTLAMIGEAEIDPGDYRALRLVILPGRSHVALRTGHVLNLARALALPDSARKAILISLATPLHVEPGVTSNLVIDFDVARSLAVREDPTSRELRFTPVIRAAERVSPARRLSQYSGPTHDEHR